MLHDTCGKCGKTPCSLIRDESENLIFFNCGDDHDGPNRENDLDPVDLTSHGIEHC